MPSLRYDRHSNFGGVTTPRLFLMFTPIESLLFSASAARTFRAPNFDELYFSSNSLTNAPLEPERSWDYDAGMSYQPNSLFQGKLTGFFARTKNLIQNDLSTNLPTNRGSQKNS